jgi:hypothetical protein
MWSVFVARATSLVISEGCLCCDLWISLRHIENGAYIGQQEFLEYNEAAAGEWLPELW